MTGIFIEMNEYDCSLDVTFQVLCSKTYERGKGESRQTIAIMWPHFHADRGAG